MVPPILQKDLAALERRINLLEAGGGTEIYQGLKKGIEQFQHYWVRKAVRHLILLTDGRTYGDEKLCIELAQKATEDGIIISALGIGHEWNDEFLDILTTQSGEHTMYAKSLRDLVIYLERTIGSFGWVYARNVHLRMKAIMMFN